MASEQPVVRQPQRIRRDRRFRQRLWALRPFFALIAVCIVAMFAAAYWRYGRPQTVTVVDTGSPVAEGLSIADGHFEFGGSSKRVITGFVRNDLKQPVRAVRVRLRLEDNNGPIGVVEVFVPQIPASGKAHFRSAEIPDAVTEYTLESIEGQR